MISRRSWAIASLILIMIVWGSTFVVTKVAVREIPLRFAIAACVLVPFAAARGGLARLPQPMPVGPLVMMGLTGIALFHIAFNYGLVYGSASQGALIFALSRGRPPRFRGGSAPCSSASWRPPLSSSSTTACCASWTPASWRPISISIRSSGC